MTKLATSTLALLMVFAVGCDSSRGEELPPPVAAASSEPLPKQRSRVWPRSAQVEEGVEYVYETGHCGLIYDLDFDGSFWEADNPNGDKEPPSFFINYDKGYITLVSENEARYESSSGQKVELHRLPGPIVVGGCA